MPHTLKITRPKRHVNISIVHQAPQWQKPLTTCTRGVDASRTPPAYTSTSPSPCGRLRKSLQLPSPGPLRIVYAVPPHGRVLYCVVLARRGLAFGAILLRSSDLRECGVSERVAHVGDLRFFVARVDGGGGEGAARRCIALRGYVGGGGGMSFP